MFRFAVEAVDEASAKQAKKAGEAQALVVASEAEVGEMCMFEHDCATSCVAMCAANGLAQVCVY